MMNLNFDLAQQREVLFRRSRILRAAALVAVSFLGWPAAEVRAEEDFFPFSVWYSGGKARAPMLEEIDETSRERWRRDVQQIKDLGFNTVRTWVEWTAGEPLPGQYNFDNLKLLAELANEMGLKLMIQVYVDSAPDWVGEQFPEAHFVAQNGARIPSQAAPGYCFDHPGVRQKILDFYAETARVASAYPNFFGWDLWSEPHIINWAIIDYIPNATFCYCPSSMERFRGWLNQKYGSLDALNSAWYRRFVRWDQVEPPRFGTILSYTDFIDWRLFILEKLAEDLRLRSEAVKGVDPSRVTTSHAAVPCLFTSPLMGVGAPDDWLMMESVDYFGTSIYPKHSFPERHWDLLRLSVLMDFARSTGKRQRGFYVGELQAGMGVRGTIVGNPVTSEDHRLWSWGLLSRGARAINVYAYYPMNSGYEAGGYGLINLDGTVTERSREIGGIAALVTRHNELFATAVPEKAQVALIYNPLAFMVGGEQHLSGAGVVRDSLTGIYRAFWRQNVPTDFVHLREVEAGLLSEYKVVFLPYPLMLTARAAEQFKNFVEQGGTLIAEARLGWNDDRGFSQDVIPGFGLDQVFRVREGKLKMEERVDIRVEAGDPLLGDLKQGDLLAGRGIREELLPYEGGKVLARFADATPAMTVASFGQGKAVAVGSFLGLANGQERNENNEKFFLGVARSAGISPTLQVEGLDGDVFIESRLSLAGERRLLFLFNHSDKAATGRMNLGQGRDLIADRRVDLGTVSLNPGEIKVFLIE
jgi:beta-galactosidase